MKNVYIDIGNFQFKYLGDMEGLFSSAYRQDVETNLDCYERIEHEGKITIIGSGKIERENIKVNREIVPPILYAITKATKDTNVNLCLLLPIEQLLQKQLLIDKFKSKSFKFKVNGQERTVNVADVVVLPEGQVAHRSYQGDKAYALMIDIGSKTTNWACYREGKLEKNGTLKRGILDFYDEVKRAENANGEDYVVEDIPHQIKRGIIKIERIVYVEFLKSILDLLKGEKINLKNYQPVFLGGGAITLEDAISGIGVAKMHNSPIFGSVRGAKIICDNLMK